MTYLGMKGFILWMLIIGLSCNLGGSDNKTMAENTAGSDQSSNASEGYYPGTISHISRADGKSWEDAVLGYVLIEGGIGSDPYADKVSAKIIEQTNIVEVRSGVRHKVTFDQLEVGQKVQVRFATPFLESYPLKATAGEIVILP